MQREIKTERMAQLIVNPSFVNVVNLLVAYLFICRSKLECFTPASFYIPEE
jgi:hypothetical protein